VTDQKRGVRLAVLAISILATACAASPPPAKAEAQRPGGGTGELMLVPNGRICVSANVNGLDAGGQSDYLVGNPIFLELRARLQADDRRSVYGRTGDNRRLVYPANSGYCDPARGDILANATLSVDKARNRYVLALQASDGKRTYSDRIVRDTADWAASRTVLTDPPGPRADLWMIVVRAGIRLDATALARRFYESVKNSTEY